VSTYQLSHLSDGTLISGLKALVAREREATAEVLAHIAETDTRQLYLQAAYPSMYTYCVSELQLSEEAAFKRIHAARAARRVPAIFGAVAEGKLHLSAVVMLAPHLTQENADELLADASHKTKSQIEQLLADRRPRPDVPAWVQNVAPTCPAPSAEPPAPTQVGSNEHAPGRVDDPSKSSPAPAATEPAERLRLKPLGRERFAVQFTMSQAALDKLRYVQELLSHQLPSGDIAAVFERALDALIPKLEKAKFAETRRPRHGHRHAGTDSRTIPADVRRAVWKRDQGRCTFVSECGHRCPARKFIEFDHVHEFARGGDATVSGIRLRCHAHNQYTAVRTYGADFMHSKRAAAPQVRAAVKARAPAARAENGTIDTTAAGHLDPARFGSTRLRRRDDVADSRQAV
jgi:hypothetical protein